MKDELDDAKAGLDAVHEKSEELVGLIGEPERPEVEKNVDDLDTAWAGINAQWAAKQKHLDEALRKASTFQDKLMVKKYIASLLSWVTVLSRKYHTLFFWKFKPKFGVAYNIRHVGISSMCLRSV